MKDEYLIVTDDIGAMYPTNIENWKAFRFPEVLGTYTGFKQKRIASGFNLKNLSKFTA